MPDVISDVQRGIRATNPSASDRVLIDHLMRHSAEEGEMLARYEALRDGVKSELARYLVDLILEDERRHHRVIDELARTIAWAGLGGDTAAPEVPALGYHETEAPEFVELTRQLLDRERQDRRELNRLRRELRDFSDTTAWTLLIDTMLLDTEKHMQLLRFVLQHVRADQPA